MTHTLACLRFLNASSFTSGADIADRLGLSRASVSTALADSEAFGIALERRHGAGYRLTQDIDWLDAAAIQAALGPASHLRVEVLPRTDSTNKRLTAEPAHGRVLAAEWQDNGRGRMGRSWQGQLGGSLLFSLCWTFPGGANTLAGLPLAVGSMLAETLADCGVAGIKLKWPNDLLLEITQNGGRKAGGILIEIAGDAMGPVSTVIGIGLNLTAPRVADQAVAGLHEGGLTLSRNALLARLLGSLEAGLQRFAQNGFSAFRSQWEARHAWAGASVNVLDPAGGMRQGLLLGLTSEGALRLQTEAGETIIHAGDVSLRRT
ncbi:BirA family transcriptional regulator, biotin operon repressor / biotin-[acetyl-CoA-carboxylase] ligase [Andreprevotia lacus DSM 23236]|jgi:BirA family biotin operon repressor/biotin-[acetyl-CoA-carboxylase] ligase|uniref:biotin--[biotin carboxyl-carrier protein] ligase n=1 Tax=Andreprevotia lacus DSM 23236 TaxID=1121001 RepID=A0A1W1XXK4_9NEIS|nr:biotin--[acetyl-CoA-carboxylase] ligase [Andreprevotia lacus]SMC28587.1 BirA family transcriptional regulator, biotin operon repressor / biotin-[acetyl-CoA-carboxylase] ligase [Andreprevotia lacus DSM 23236]